MAQHSNFNLLKKNIKMTDLLKVYIETDFWDDSVRSSLDHLPSETDEINFFKNPNI